MADKYATLRELNQGTTRLFLILGCCQSAVTFLLVYMGVDTTIIDREIFDPHTESYRYPEHQYWLKLFSIISMPFITYWVFVNARKVRKLEFPEKTGSGNIGLLFLVGLLGIFYVFWDFDGGEGAFMKLRLNTLIGTHIFTLFTQALASVPFVWVFLYIKWKIRKRHG